MKILFIFLAFIFFSCSPERVKPPVDVSFSDENIPAQESWNAVVSFSDSGKIRAILYAGHIRMYPDKHETLLDSNLKIDFYDVNQNKTTTLTAKKGRVDDVTNDLFAIDSVVAKNDSVIITTDEMRWKNKTRKIISDKFVTILSPKEKIQGFGFESDQNLKNYVIYKITYITRRDTL